MAEGQRGVSPPARSPTAHFAVAVGRLYNRSQNLEPGRRLRAGGLHTYNVFKPATIKAQSGSLVIKRWCYWPPDDAGGPCWQPRNEAHWKIPTCRR